jgi:enoyl-CoA hydratase
MTDQDGIAVERADGVLTIRFNRPHVLNALNEAIIGDLADLVIEAGADPDVRVVVLTGAGRAFCSGADLGGGTVDKDNAPGPETMVAANRLARALRDVPKPVVASVNGPAAGIGCSIALACDLVVASESAYFLLAFINIALMPDGGASALVPANVGRARAMEMALLGERVPAAKAVEWGLAYRAVPAEELEATVGALAAKLAAAAPRAMAATKHAVNAASLAPLDAALDRELDGQTVLLGTDDFFEAVAAFGEKRAPKFTGA